MALVKTEYHMTYMVRVKIEHRDMHGTVQDRNMVWVNIEYHDLHDTCQDRERIFP